jgi:hypothetical protein
MQVRDTTWAYAVCYVDSDGYEMSETFENFEYAKVLFENLQELGVKAEIILEQNITLFTKIAG